MNLVSSINNAKSFEEMHSIVKHAEVHSSYLFNHSVTVPGLHGTCSLSRLMARVMELIDKNPHFNMRERIYGWDIGEHIHDLYVKSQVQVNKTMNRFILFFVLIAPLFYVLHLIKTVVFGSSPSIHNFWGYTRWGDRGGYRDVFYHYTSDQHLFKFWSFPSKAKKVDDLFQFGTFTGVQKTDYYLDPNGKCWNPESRKWWWQRKWS